MDQLVQALALATVTMFGLLFGSFANVLIWRVPRDESIVAPGSHCPSCEHPIRWYDNVPILSWLVLRGRCRDCGTPISSRYPLVEATSGLLWLAAVVRFGVTPRGAACIALFYLLLVLTFIDLDTYRLPNVLVATMAGIGLGGALVSQFAGIPLVPLVGMTGSGVLGSPLAVALLGAVTGAGFTGIVAWVYSLVRGRSGLGAGDVKLLGAMGLFTGPFVLISIVVGSLTGAVFGVASSRRAGEATATHRIPFGPFLAFGGVCAVLWGDTIWTWYSRLIGIG